MSVRVRKWNGVTSISNSDYVMIDLYNVIGVKYAIVVQFGSMLECITNVREIFPQNKVAEATGKLVTKYLGYSLDGNNNDDTMAELILAVGLMHENGGRIDVLGINVDSHRHIFKYQDDRGGSG